jgi:hypothetical protein
MSVKFRDPISAEACVLVRYNRYGQHLFANYVRRE